MRQLALVLALLAGCSDGDSQSGNAAAPVAPAAGKGAGEGGVLTSLTGLYEGGDADPRNQLCMVPGEGGTTRFGLVVWGANMHSCSGSGTASRDGDALRLAMAGDEACTIEAKIAGTTIRFPAAIPDGCAYYCGARAAMDGAAFTRVGATRADAARAKDLVGEPLCSGGGS
ncbi:MAG TPA: hypothetical protein VGW34_00925 [Allosphingosinicella sp.]|nr:hypothetical protein [Allosphingosinicella sp.]